MGTGHFVVEGGEMGPVENEDYVGSLVRFENGARGTLENSRTCIGPHVRNSFEVNGTRGALSWDFQRLNELELYRSDATGDRGYRTVFAAPGMGDYLKVTEACTFLTSIAEDRQREPGMREIVSTMHVVDAMDRSCDSGGWEAVSAEATTTAASERGSEGTGA